MRKIIEIIAGDLIDLSLFGIELEKHNIEKIWTIIDEERIWNWKKFDPYTGKPVEVIDKDINKLRLTHREGVFIEDRGHDWNIRDRKYLYYFSRVTKQGEKVKILIEYSET